MADMVTTQKKMTMHRTQKVLRVVSIALIVVLIGSYAYTHIRSAFLGPNIELTESFHGTTVSEPLIELSGVAIRTSSLAINDTPALIEENGLFKASLLLALGYNIIEITAVDRFGRESTNHIEIMYNPLKTNG